jgi:hypothetical protein
MERRTALMSTTIRHELTKKNKYWVEKHRYYELKHFCLQYPIWKQAYASLDGLSKRPDDLSRIQKTNDISDPTGKCAEAKLYYSDRILMIEDTANEVTPELSTYIIKAVTEGVSYEHLKTRLDIPCSRDTYYDLYRQFFWLLNKARK